MKVLRAYNIEQWAGTLDARAAMPALLRQLIHATVGDASRVDFPAWEGIQRPGWDGVVVSPTGNAFVPAGTSLWEIGTTADVKGKADDDYEKRTSDPNGALASESTFVFVSPRKWTGKNAWCHEKKALGEWKDIRAYDSDDLEQWLETAPAVAIWFGRMLGVRPAGVDDVERYWESVSSLTHPPLLSVVFVASRSDEEQRLLEWISGPPGALAIECRAPTEVLDFVAAALVRLEPARRDPYLSRSLIVESRNAFDVLRDSAGPLILLVAPRLALEPDLISSATRKGHHVLVAVTRIAQDRVTTISLPRAYRHELAKALEQCGFTEVDSERASRAAGGSLAILKRRMANIPTANRPSWADAASSSAATPFLWIGGWTSKSDADRQAVARLTGRCEMDNERAANALAECEEPLLIHGLGSWALLSKDDAWMLLGPQAGESEFSVFEQLAAEVLGEDDPRLDMPPNERVYANIHGSVRRHSSLMRKNIAETIALLASLHETIGLPATWSVPARITALVRRVLPQGGSWKRWASLESNLPLLAEASPDAFLGAVEADLASPEPELVKLLTEQGDTVFGGGCHHAGLLWALETLAWTPSHLTRVCRILLDLADRDPGGKWANRPAASAAEILLPWYPQTTATAEQRIQVCDAMLSHKPDAGWRIIHSLLPQHMGHSTPTHRPYWRDWPTTWRPGTTHREYWLQVNACAERLIDHAGARVDRWLLLVDAIERIPAALHQRLLDSLATLAKAALATEDRRKIADAIRQKISLSRKYPDADWSLPNTLVDSLEPLRTSFEPDDCVLKHQWLFAEWPEHFDDEQLSYEESQARLLEARRAALGEVLAADGLGGVERLASLAEAPGAVGAILADLRGDEFLGGIIPALLVSDDDKLQQLANGFVWQRFRTEGWPWVDRMPIREWSANAAACFLSCLPFERETWKRATSVGTETDDAYWRRAGAWNHELAEVDVEYAARQLVARRRAIWAVRLIRMAEHQHRMIGTTVILESLEGIYHSEPELLRHALSGNASHDISELVSVLQRRAGCDESRLASLEWNFLRLLDRADTGPVLLHRWLATHPSFFLEILSCLYRSDNDSAVESQATEDAQAKARSAFDLLHHWRTIPGTQPDGSISAQELRNWIEDARRLATESGHVSVCDSTIGELLAHAPEGTDGSWPCQPVGVVLDAVGSDSMLRGFEIGIYNSRGVTARGHHEGGDQERALAQKFDDHAQGIEITCPRTAAVLRNVAEHYRHDARQEDEEARWDS